MIYLWLFWFWWQVCDQPHPLLVLSIVKHTLNENIDDAYVGLKQLYDLGYAASDIITTLFRVVKNYDMPEFLKLEYIRVSWLCNCPFCVSSSQVNICILKHGIFWELLATWWLEFPGVSPISLNWMYSILVVPLCWTCEWDSTGGGVCPYADCRWSWKPAPVIWTIGQTVQDTKEIKNIDTFVWMEVKMTQNVKCVLSWTKFFLGISSTSMAVCL